MSHMFGIRPWEADLLTLDELVEYRQAAKDLLRKRRR